MGTGILEQRKSRQEEDSFVRVQAMASSSSTVEVFEDVGSSDKLDQELELELQLETETTAPAAPGTADLHRGDANPVAPVAPAQTSYCDSDGHSGDDHEGEGEGENEHDETSTSTTDYQQQQQQQKPSSSGSAVHAHRVNHNSSKLPAFRLSDRSRSSLPLAGLPQRDSKQHPPSSAGLSGSPLHHHDRQTVTNPAPQPENRPGTTNNAAADDDTATDAQHLQFLQSHHQSHHLHRPVTASAPTPAPTSTPELHTRSNQQLPPGTPQSHSPVTSRTKNSPARSRASTYQTASTSAPFTPVAAKRPASFPVDNSPGDAVSFQSPTPTDGSPSFWTPETRPPTQPVQVTPSSNSATSPPTTHQSKGTQRTPEATTKRRAQGQQALTSPAPVHGASPHDSPAERRTSTSRPPVSYKPLRSASTPSRTSIPPIRSFRSSGSRKSLQLDMNNSFYLPYDDSHRPSDPNPRDQSLRALEGLDSGEWQRDRSSAEGDDEVTATIESESTADIFMRIAHENPPASSSRPGNDGRDEGDRASTVVSPPLPFLCQLPQHCFVRNDTLETLEPLYPPVTQLWDEGRCPDP
jgi:hypothetical protein